MARKKLKIATDQRPFVMVYNDFLDSDLLNYYEKLVFIYLKKFTNPSTNQCFPSIKTLANLTGISVNKVKSILKELEAKGVISKTNRTRPDGGSTSNCYTLYDFAEIWGVSGNDNIESVAAQVDEQKLVAQVRAMGYTVSKEKEPKSETDQSTDLSPINKHFSESNNTQKDERSQPQERYSLEDIKDLFEYSVMVNDFPQLRADVDNVITILHETLNTTKKTVRIASEDLPAMPVIGKLMKLTRDEILYSIRKYAENVSPVKNPRAYMLTILYRAKEQYALDIQNQVSRAEADVDENPEEEY